MKRTIPSFLAILTLATISFAQVGAPLPPAELEGFAQTPAKTYDDYIGRLVLVEFFAYW